MQALHLRAWRIFQRANADSFELFVADDALEGRAFVEPSSIDDFELFGESDTREGVALPE